MVERVGVSETDLRRLLEAVDPARIGDPGEFVPDSCLRDLPELFGCDAITVQVVDPYRRQFIGIQAVRPDPLGRNSDLQQLLWPAFWEAFSHPQRSGDFVSVTRSSHRLPGVRWGPRWHEFWDAKGGPPKGPRATVPLPPYAGVDRRFLLWQGNAHSEFTDRDIFLLTLLRPHLIALYEAQQMARNDAPQLTPRQWEVLRLVRAGRTNSQIAGVLVISEGTVRKHLENIYERLEVGSRTEALAKAAL